MARPDKTWSDWSDPLTNVQDSLIRSPNARYIQWRASLEGPGAAIERDLREAIAVAQTQGAGTHEAHARARLLELLPHLAVAH